MPTNNNEQEKSNTSGEIALMRQAMQQMVESQKDFRIQYADGQRELKEIIERQYQDHENRLRFLETRTVELSARLTMWQIIQTTFTTVASAIATALGRLP